MRKFLALAGALAAGLPASGAIAAGRYAYVLGCDARIDKLDTVADRKIESVDLASRTGRGAALIPKVEGFKILGTIFSSSLFPNRAPGNFVTLTSYIGGERQPELTALPSEKLIELVCEDLRVLLGVKGKPAFQHVALYPKAIPQYNVGYGKFKGLLNEIETKAPNLFFAGHYRDGVSLGDSIVSGVNIAERVGKTF